MPETRSKVMVSIKMPRPLIQRLDAYRAQLGAATPGLEVNRSEAVIVLLTFALDSKRIEAPSEDAPAFEAPSEDANRTRKRSTSRAKGGRAARKP